MCLLFFCRSLLRLSFHGYAFCKIARLVDVQPFRNARVIVRISAIAVLPFIPESGDLPLLYFKSAPGAADTKDVDEKQGKTCKAPACRIG